MYFSCAREQTCVVLSESVAAASWPAEQNDNGAIHVANQCKRLDAAGSRRQIAIDRWYLVAECSHVWRTSANDHSIELFAPSPWQRRAATKPTMNPGRRVVESVPLCKHPYDRSLVESLDLLSANPLECSGKYRPSAAWKLVHWPLMGGLLHLVQRRGDYSGPAAHPGPSSLYQM